MKKFLLLVLPITIMFFGCTTPSQDPPDKCIGHFQFEVLQVLDDGLLAWICRRHNEPKLNRQLVYIPVNTKGEIYFDGQIINRPKGTCPIYTGSYSYITKGGDDKTVAKVEFVNPQLQKENK